MKYVKINAYQIGLVMKNGKYLNVISEGRYWFWSNEKVLRFSENQQLDNTLEIEYLLTNPSIANHIQVVEIKDNELGLQYLNDRFQSVFTTGIYAFWKGIKNFEVKIVDINQIDIQDYIDIKSIGNRMGAFIRTYTIESYEKGLLLIDGKLDRILEGGTYNWWKNNTQIQVAKADVRQTQLEISGQEILSKDKANLRLSVFLQYQIEDIKKALFDNNEFEKQLYVIIQLSMREYVGNLTLDELLEKKDQLNSYILEKTKDKVSAMGIVIKNCGVRDVILPGDMKEIINQVLIAEKKAQANIIMRREETASMRSLLNTAKLMEDNETLWKLKEMEYVEKIADKIGTISVNGNGQIVDQLKQIFAVK